ncbi:hypothetical protein A8B78_08965 [Jannaschia sp. EhC01]|nr:hypothetical protein A8B78_08965 [Jannaschia sp. EhC01]
MKTGALIAAIIALIAIGFGIYMIDIDQTEEMSVPTVTIEGGNLPEYDAEVGDVEVTEETITVPSLEVTPPDADDS